MIDHTFVSAVADGADASLIRPSNWNATHWISLATSGNETIPAAKAAYVPNSFEISGTDTVEIAAGATLEIG